MTKAFVVRCVGTGGDWVETCAWRRFPGAEEPQPSLRAGRIRCTTAGDGYHHAMCVHTELAAITAVDGVRWAQVSRS